MSKMLITYSDNWTDEMDLDGLFVCSSDEWEKYKETVKKYFESNDSYTYYVGTNEEIEYNTAKELLSTFEIICSDIHSSGLGGLEFCNFLPIGFTGPEIEIDEEDEDDE